MSLKPYTVTLLTILCALTSALYWPGLKGGFFFDDAANILEPEAIQLSVLSVNHLLDVIDTGIAGPLGRPISLVSFALNHYLSGFDPFYFKLTNLILHCINGILVFFLTRLLITAAFQQDKREISVAALLIATAWAIHPIQLTSVLYVVQRMTSLATLFVLTALILHIWARQLNNSWKLRLPALFFAWAVFFPLGLYSKETAATFVLYIAIYELVLHRQYRGRLDRFAISYLMLILIASLITLSHLILNLDGLSTSYAGRPFTLTERLLTESRIIWSYLGMIALPSLSDFGLYHDDITLSTGWLSPITTAFSILGIVGALVLAWQLRRRSPLIAFSIFWYLAGHSLESSIIPLELMHEHRNYLPSFGVFLPLALLLHLAIAKINNRISAYCAIAAFLAYTAMLTYLRSEMYANDVRRSLIETSFHPNSVRSNYEAGTLLAKTYGQQPKKDILRDMAEKHFALANHLDSDFTLGLIGMLQLDCISNHGARTEVISELAKRLASNRWILTDRIALHGIGQMTHSGALCLTHQQAISLFSAALGNSTLVSSERSWVRTQQGLFLWLVVHDYPSAQQAFNLAMAEDKQDPASRSNLLQLLRLLGDHKGALAILDELESMTLKRHDRKFVLRVRKEMEQNAAVIK